MAQKSPTCPNCGKSDLAFKVSHIYIEASERKPLPGQEMGALQAVYANLPPGTNPAMAKRSILQLFAPPSGRTEIIRQVHPDLIVGISAAVALFILYQILASQPGFFLPALIIFIVALAAYLFTRKSVLRKFNRIKAEDAGDRKNVERAIERWMQLYYCARDQTLFDTDRRTPIALKDMQAYLFRKE